MMPLNSVGVSTILNTIYKLFPLSRRIQWLKWFFFISILLQPFVWEALTSRASHILQKAFTVLFTELYILKQSEMLLTCTFESLIILTDHFALNNTDFKILCKLLCKASLKKYQNVSVDDITTLWHHNHLLLAKHQINPA